MQQPGQGETMARSGWGGRVAEDGGWRGNVRGGLLRTEGVNPKNALLMMFLNVGVSYQSYIFLSSATWGGVLEPLAASGPLPPPDSPCHVADQTKRHHARYIYIYVPYTIS